MAELSESQRLEALVAVPTIHELEKEDTLAVHSELRAWRLHYVCEARGPRDSQARAFSSAPRHLEICTLRVRRSENQATSWHHLLKVYCELALRAMAQLR